MLFAATGSVYLGLLTIVSAQETEGLRPEYYKKWRENPKVCCVGLARSLLHLQVSQTYISSTVASSSVVQDYIWKPKERYARVIYAEQYEIREPFHR